MLSYQFFSVSSVWFLEKQIWHNRQKISLAQRRSNVGLKKIISQVFAIDTCRARRVFNISYLCSATHTIPWLKSTNHFTERKKWRPSHELICQDSSSYCTADATSSSNRETFITGEHFYVSTLILSSYIEVCNSHYQLKHEHWLRM